MDVREKEQIALYILSGLMSDYTFCAAQISSTKPTLQCFWGWWDVVIAVNGKKDNNWQNAAHFSQSSAVGQTILCF